MSDGVLDNPQDGIRILVNLVGLRVHAVRSYKDAKTHEVRVVRSLGNDVALIWSCVSMAHATAQAELLWERNIPARVVTDMAAETVFLAGLTGGKEDA